MSKNNSIVIGVKITVPPIKIAHSDDHTRNMWEMRAERERLSGNATDYFTIRFPESACPDCSKLKAGDIVELYGEICSSDTLNPKERLAHIYADQIEIAKTVQKNFAQLCGRICAAISTYENPRNNRKYTTLKLSVKNRGSRQYINVTASGKLTDDIKKIGTGKFVNVSGVLRYREYAKTKAGKTQIRSVYEVSARTIALSDLKENNKGNEFPIEN